VNTGTLCNKSKTTPKKVFKRHSSNVLALPQLYSHERLHFPSFIAVCFGQSKVKESDMYQMCPRRSLDSQFPVLHIHFLLSAITEAYVKRSLHQHGLLRE
jgi:hypothetical protein